MALREQQISRVRILQALGFVIHAISTSIVFLASFYFWLRIVIEVPEELRLWLAVIPSTAFFFSLFRIEKEGYVTAPLWFGWYMDVSYSGIYVLIKPPLPIALFICWIFMPELSKKFFMSQGTEVAVRDIAVKVTSQFLSNEREGESVRMRADSTLIFKMESVARYQIQTTNDTDQGPLLEAVTALYTASIKSSSLSQYSAQDIYLGAYQKDETALVSSIMQQFDLIKNYGLSLSNSPIVAVMFENPKIERTFDQIVASGLLDRSANRLADRVAAFMKKNPGMDEAVVHAMLRGSSGEDGGADLSYVRVR